MMNQHPRNFNVKLLLLRQQSGVVLFVALIALVAMSLAAVSLIRSVDSNNMIAGNLSSKQAATSSADVGVEAAINALETIRDSGVGMSPINNDGHPLNNTNTTDNTKTKFHSSLSNNNTVGDEARRVGVDTLNGNTVNGEIALTDEAAWNDANSNEAVENDSVGNEVRYLIQRMCRRPNVASKDADCIYSGATKSPDGNEVPLADEICDGDGCPTAGQAPLYRITVRVRDYRNSFTYVQTIVH